MWLLLLIIFAPQRETFYDLYNTGVTLLEQGEYQDAVDHFERAIVLRANPAANAKTYGVQLQAYFPYHKLALSRIGTKDFDGARQALNKAYEMEEDSMAKDVAASMQSLKVFLVSMEQIEADIKAAKTPRTPPMADLVERLLEGKNSETLSYVKLLLVSFPDNEELLSIQESLEKQIASDKAYQAEQKRIQDSLQQRLVKAREHEVADRLNEALADYISIQRFDPDNDEAIAAAERVRVKLEERGESEATINALIEESRDKQADFFKQLEEQQKENERLLRAADQERKAMQRRLSLQKIPKPAPEVSVTWNLTPIDVGERRLNLSPVINSSVPLEKAELIINNQYYQTYQLDGSKSKRIVALENHQFDRQKNDFTFRLYDVDGGVHFDSYSYPFGHVEPRGFYLTRTYKSILIMVVCALFATGFFLSQQRRRKAFRERFNPYIAGAPVLNESMFYGRLPIVKQILNALHNNSLMIYGERRIGKTSFLHRLNETLPTLEDPDYEFIPIFIDLQGIREEDFFATLEHEIAMVLAAREITLPDEEGPVNSRKFISRLRKYIGLLKSQCVKKPKLVLLLDEVDVMNSFSEQTNQQLRSVFMKGFADHIVAVMAGIHINTKWKSEGSPWYNFFEQIQLKPFTRKQADELITKPVKGVYQYTSGAIDRIVEITNCKPYLIQKMCLNLVSLILVENRRKITQKDVDTVFKDIEKEFRGAEEL